MADRIVTSEKQFHIMRALSFEQLTDLVLVDVLAALPMLQLVRLAQLCKQRLRAISCRQWVLRRMTDVDFPTAVKAHQAGGSAREAFCGEAVLKRLNGRVDIYLESFIQNVVQRSASLQLIEIMPGNLHMRFCGHYSHLELVNFTDKLPRTVLGNVRYINHKIGKAFEIFDTQTFPNMVVHFSEEGMNMQMHLAFIRPALLNGRNIVDVQRAVCGPSAFDETVLNITKQRGRVSQRRLRGEHENVWLATWPSYLSVFRIEDAPPSVNSTSCHQ